MQCGLGASSQADRLCLQRWRGRGGQARGLQIHRSSSLFALQWFSHQTRLLNQGPPPQQRPPIMPTSDAPPTTLVPLCPYPGFVIRYSVLSCFHSFLPVSLSLLLRLTSFSRSESNGKTLCCICGLLLVSHSAPLKNEERPIKDFLLFSGGNCNCG